MKILAVIPARSGSQRVKNKNIRLLNNHPLIAYSISSAKKTKIFDRIIVSTDSKIIKDIALYYGAEVPFLRPKKISTSKSIDYSWIIHALNKTKEIYNEEYDYFAILRPTTPHRSNISIIKAVNTLVKKKHYDSIRAVSKCREHPGKMWTISNNKSLKEFLNQSHLKIKYHEMQYQSLPEVYIQTSSFEVIKVKSIIKNKNRAGDRIIPFKLQKLDGMAIDHEEDLILLKHYLQQKKIALPVIRKKPYEFKS